MAGAKFEVNMLRRYMLRPLRQLYMLSRFLGSFGVIGRVLFLILILRLMDKILHDPYA